MLLLQRPVEGWMEYDLVDWSNELAWRAISYARMHFVERCTDELLAHLSPHPFQDRAHQE